MIDLHSHILPGIDDGSRDSQMSQGMLEELSRQGVQVVIATPHFYASRHIPETFMQRRAAALEQLSAVQGSYPQIIPGAEVAYFNGMGRSDILNHLQLGHSGLLLVEMPFCPWTQRMVRDICELPSQTGLTPVLAHVDRYRKRNQLLRYMDQLLNEGVLFQCNAEAFLSLSSRRWALKLLEAGCIHFLGSDAHNLTTRPPRLQQAAAVIAKKLGSDTLDALTASARDLLKI